MTTGTLVATTANITTANITDATITKAAVGTLNVSKNADVRGSLTVGGMATFESNVAVSGKTTTGSLQVRNDAAVAGQLTVDGNTTLGGSLTVKRDASFERDVSIKGNLMVGQVRNVEKEIRKIERSINVGASALVNVIAHELTPDSLVKEGISFNATVGTDTTGGSEVRLGVNKDMGDGIHIGLGVGLESGKIGLSVGKTIDLNEHVRVGIGASATNEGLDIGPTVMFHKDGYGIGASTFGPSVMINGVPIPVAGPMAAPNLVVTGIVGAYKAVTGKTKAEIDDLKKQLATMKNQASSAQDTQTEVAALKKELALTKLDLEELKLQMDMLLSGVAPAEVKTKISEQRETQLRAEIQKNEASIRRELEELKSILSDIIKSQKK